MDADGCCSPSRGAGAVREPAGNVVQPGPAASSQMAVVEIPAGEALLGSTHPLAYPADGEGPVRRVRVDAFAIAPHAVTNAEFARFVEATGYVTQAEGFEWSFVFGGLLPDDFPDTRGVVDAPWWRQVLGASWRNPEGPHSSVDGRERHPVVHVSFEDALAYCAWAGARLPREAEWEYAARGGLEGKLFPWGDELSRAASTG